ncbi:MAG: hypothetical protein ABI690_13925 [Chloroflexota bacterium]
MSQKKSRLSEYRKPLTLEFVQWCLRLPRLVRIIVVAIFALAFTLAVSPAVDYAYLAYMFTEETRVLPSLVSAAIGIAFYVLGWWLMIGTVGETRPARPAVLVYVLVGIIALCLVIVLALSGYSEAITPI